jgi:hypothetical protein
MTNISSLKQSRENPSTDIQVIDCLASNYAKLTRQCIRDNSAQKVVNRFSIMMGGENCLIKTGFLSQINKIKDTTKVFQD